MSLVSIHVTGKLTDWFAKSKILRPFTILDSILWDVMVLTNIFIKLLFNIVQVLNAKKATIKYCFFFFFILMGDASDNRKQGCVGGLLN